mmetsp:Transcript_44101/g.138973  ORF Transcript_44101/g.138973 Transcript_44101/m.138973 type:complete len:149 (+) Transcript_44101:235-681(+)
MAEVRASGRAAAQANANVSASRTRVTISDESMAEIHAEMPTSSDGWEVEAVIQYRMMYGVEQWLVKWKGYREDRNTWEHLLTAEVQAEAGKVKDASLPTSKAGLEKLTLPHLSDALTARGLDLGAQARGGRALARCPAAALVRFPSLC